MTRSTPMQDAEDDALIGVKSTALKFGARSKPAIAGFYGGGPWQCLPWPDGAQGRAGASGHCWAWQALHLAWQVIALKSDNPANCLRLFRS